MATFVIPPGEMVAEVNDILAVSYATFGVHLCLSVPVLTPPFSLAALTAIEATFTGYAFSPQTGTSGGYLDPVRQGASFTSENIHFAVGATPTVFNQIYGFWVDWPDPTPANIALICAFNSFVPMLTALDQINLQFSLNYFGQGGIVVTVNGELQ